MLSFLDSSEAKKYAGFAYSIAAHIERGCYPIFPPELKSQDDFQAYYADCCTAENYYTMRYVGESGEGIIQFFRIPDDRYIQLCGLYIDGDVSAALYELLHLMGKNFPGHELYFGIPAANRAAAENLTSSGFECEEALWHDVFLLDGYSSGGIPADVVRVTQANFSLFSALHNADTETYWTSGRIYDDIDNWRIFAVVANGRACAVAAERGGEIFSLDFDGTIDEEIYGKLIKAALHDVSAAGLRYLVFFNSDSTQDFATRLGFRCFGKYELYYKKLPE